MNIGYLSYLNPYSYMGGGEQIMKDVINYGKELGHNIEVFSVKGGAEERNRFMQRKDIFLLTDIYNCFTHPHFYPFGMLKEIVENHRFVHFDNAYVDICNLDYLPCGGVTTGTKCAYKSRTFECRRTLASLYKIGFRNAYRDIESCFKVFTFGLYKNAIMNVFLSPLHMKTILGLLQNHGITNTYVIRPVIDTAQFMNKKGDRDISNLYVGAINKAKGIENIKAMFPDGDIVLIGALDKGSYRNYGEWLGYVEHGKIQEYFNRAKNFVHLPEWPEPLGRVVVEAALCGCNLILNERVGAASFGFELADPNNYQDSLDMFWERISNLS